MANGLKCTDMCRLPDCDNQPNKPGDEESGEQGDEESVDKFDEDELEDY